MNLKKNGLTLHFEPISFTSSVRDCLCLIKNKRQKQNALDLRFCAAGKNFQFFAKKEIILLFITNKAGKTRLLPLTYDILGTI